MCILLALGVTAPLTTMMGYVDDISKMGTIFGEVIGILEHEKLKRSVSSVKKTEEYSVELRDVSGGSILIGGIDIRELTLADYNRNIAYVSQDNYLFDDTVMENIRMGRQSAADEEVIQAAKDSGCYEFIM